MKTLKSILLANVILLMTFETQGQEIFDAIKNNDLAKTKEMIKKNVSLSSLVDASGNTPLHQAAITGNVPITEFLLQKGADIDATNIQGNTPLHEAIIIGKDNISEYLIAKGSSIQKKGSYQRTALHLATRYNRIGIAKLLIEKGADIESKAQNNRTPLLLLTLMTENVEAAKLLITSGANVNAIDSLKQTPLFNAVHGGRIDMINLLLDYKADFDTSGNQAKIMLSWAAGLGHAELFNYIIGKAGDQLFNNEQDRNNYMRMALSGGSIEIVQILKSKNIPINLEANISGWTPIHYCAANNKAEMLEFVVKNGCNINKLTNSGKSAYNIAEENGNKELLNLIVKLGGTTEPQKFPLLTGPYYGQKTPGQDLTRFAPGIVSSGHSSISLSPNGNEIYWANGPHIMMTKLENGYWTKPEIASFSGKGEIDMYDDVPFVTPDNKRLFFTSMRPIGTDVVNKENIWYVEREGGKWGEPKPVSPEINASTLHWQVSVSEKGTLYFAGGSAIYYALLEKGEYKKPIRMDEKIGNNSSCPFISPDETYITFSRNVSGVPIPYISFKSKDGQWLEPISIEKYIGKSNCMIVSPDKKYLFTKGGWWIDASFIEELRPKE